MLGDRDDASACVSRPCALLRIPKSIMNLGGSMNFRPLARSVVGGTLAALMLVTAPTRAQTPAPTSVRAAYIPVITWLPAWVAKEKGFFAKHGLDVTLSVAQNLSVLPGTVGRQFEFVPSTAPDLIKAVASGLDVVAVAASVFETEDNSSTQLMVAKDSGIASAKDLTGKLIATPTIGGVIHVSVLYWLKKNGVDPATVRAVEVPFPNMADQLKAKRVDAVEAVEPFVGALRAAGNVSLTAPLLSAGKEVLFPFWISSGEWARSHGPVVAAWKASLDDAIAFIKENPEEARKIVAQYTKLPEPVVKATPFPTYRTAITAKDIEVWANVMREIDQLPNPVDPAKLVVTQ
jgi:NitT/TauT family transport system substrate-binding protein